MRKQAPQDSSHSASDWQPSHRLLEANRRLYELRRAHRLQKQSHADKEVFARQRQHLFACKHPAGQTEQGGAQ